MALMVERNKWIFYRHTCNYELIKAVALDVKNACKTDISDVERHRMQERLVALNLYKTRNPEEKPLDAVNHRINTLKYWMFGYEDKVDNQKRFIFSPLGNLFLKNINDEGKLKRIFITMLFGFQFQHPSSGTNKEFKLFPFRLIFQLLLDSRLDGKLYNNEVEYLLFFVKTMSDNSDFNTLVDKILKLRQITGDEMATLFKQDEHVFVNAVYEWEYYTQELFEQIGIIERHRGDFICKLFSPTKTNSKSPPTGRAATHGFISIVPEQKNFIEKMLERYSCFEPPIQLNDPERLQIDCVKEIYSFYPKLLLDTIGESEKLSEALELPMLIEKYSNNPDNETAYLFEQILTDGFNMFHNVEAIWRGGAGHTDIEGLYITKSKKFAVDAKSTANKLLGINSGRLREHRDEIGGAYSIVITPRYVPATKRDIKNQPIVIILASTFAEYLYNHIFHDVRDVDYSDFDEIITENLGTDISKLISNMTLNKFAAN